MRYASIRNMDISNGEGVGVALFVQGCHFHCHNCFNPETWDFTKGKEWNEQTEDIFLNLINKPYITRVSFLGGECLADENVREIYNLIKKIREQYKDKKIWLYTGYTWREIFKDDTRNGLLRQKVVKLCDILVDGRYIQVMKDGILLWAGSTNQNVIDIKATYELNNGFSEIDEDYFLCDYRFQKGF